MYGLEAILVLFIWQICLGSFSSGIHRPVFWPKPTVPTLSQASSRPAHSPVADGSVWPWAVPIIPYDAQTPSCLFQEHYFLCMHSLRSALQKTPVYDHKVLESNQWPQDSCQNRLTVKPLWYQTYTNGAEQRYPLLGSLRIFCHSQDSQFRNLRHSKRNPKGTL